MSDDEKKPAIFRVFRDIPVGTRVRRGRYAPTKVLYSAAGIIVDDVEDKTVGTILPAAAVDGHSWVEFQGAEMMLTTSSLIIVAPPVDKVWVAVEELREIVAVLAKKSAGLATMLSEHNVRWNRLYKEMQDQDLVDGGDADRICEKIRNAITGDKT